MQQELLWVVWQEDAREALLQDLAMREVLVALGRGARILLASTMSSIWQSWRQIYSGRWTYQLTVLQTRLIATRPVKFTKVTGLDQRQSQDEALIKAPLEPERMKTTHLKTLLPLEQSANRLPIDQSRRHNFRESTVTTNMTSQRLMHESRCKLSKCSSLWVSLAWRLTVTRVQEVVRRISNLLSRLTIWKMEEILKEQLVRPPVTHPQSCKHKLPPNWEWLTPIPRSKRMFLAWTSRFLKSCLSYLLKKWASSLPMVARVTMMHNDFHSSKQSWWIKTTAAVPRADQEVQRSIILRKWSSLMFPKSSPTKSLPIQPILIITKSWELPHNNQLHLLRMHTIKTRSKRVKTDRSHLPFRAKLWPLVTLIRTVLPGKTAHTAVTFSWVKTHQRLVKQIKKILSPTSSELSRWSS